MDRVTHRDLRNNSGEVLRRAEAGEVIIVTSRGHAVAVIGPVPTGTLDEIIDSGAARPASRSPETLRDLVRSSSSLPSAAILRDVRGDH